MARIRVPINPEPVEPVQQPQVIADDIQPAQQQTPPRTQVTYTEPAVEQVYQPAPEQQATVTTMPSQGIFISRRKAMWVVIAVVLTVGLITAIANRERPTGPSGTLGTSQELPGATAEAQQYYNEISPFVELPSGEAPTVLNVSDAEVVKKDNAALTDIKNGDKMLFFTKSRKLVVYRPGTKKVVAVVSLAAPAATTPKTTR